MAEVVGITKNRIVVIGYPNIRMALKGGLTMRTINDVISGIEFPPYLGYRKYEFDLMEPIGYSHCVETDLDDDIVMVYRHGCIGKTPMVKNREPKLDTSLTVVLEKRNDTQLLVLTDALIGSDYQLEPWDPRVKGDSVQEKLSKQYWQNHAMIYDPFVIDYERA